MVLTRSQRLAMERDERHANGIFTDDESSSNSDQSSSSSDSDGPHRKHRRSEPGKVEDSPNTINHSHPPEDNSTPKGKGCRVVRHQLTYEEEMMLEKQQREAKRALRVQNQWLQEHNIPTRERPGIDYSSRRPEREAAKRALKIISGRSSSDEDELLTMPGRKRNENANTTVTYRPSSRNTQHAGDDDDLLLMHNGSNGVSSAASRRMSMGQQLNRMLSNGPPSSSHSRHQPRDDEGGHANDGNDSDRENNRIRMADVQPIEVDMKTTFAQVGGLPSHILTLRETVLIPLLYPKLLTALAIKPPRGLLFVGPPGTGKTLMARALAAEGTRVAGTGQKVSFFLRKGADVLSKWMGESEKQLRMLFDEARRHEPSIIFFDEIDGLAPIRHGKQDQSYAALVSTLLALMDGLTDRGRVVVIGATNRPDTLDPALRRPGRFDRELRFPMPDATGRRQIIDIHMQGQSAEGGAEGKAKIRESLVNMTSGWSGADLQSLCTAASLHSLRRSVPQIYVSQVRLKVPMSMIKVKGEDYTASLRSLNPSVQRVSSGSVAAAYVPQHLERLLEASVHAAVAGLGEVWAPAASALERSETEARALKGADQTRQLVFALTTQLISSLAATPQASVAILLADPATNPTAADRLFMTSHVAKGLINRLPSMYARTVHLPNIGRSATTQAASPPPGDQNLFVAPSEDAPTSIAEMFSIMRSCTPGLLLLLGFEEWSNAASEEDLASFKYNLEMIAQSDVAVIVPLGYAPVTPFDETSVRHLLKKTHTTSRPTEAQKSIIQCVEVKEIINDIFAIPSLSSSTCIKLEGPTRAQKEALLKEMHDTFLQAETAVNQQVEALTILCGSGQQSATGDTDTHIVMPWPQLAIDDAPPPERKRTSLDKQRAHEHWATIEHKRRQLKYTLSQWVSGFMASKKFQYFLSADLDFTPDHEFWAGWQKHVRGKKIGLQDIYSKLENDEYPCLSAFVEDLERLCNNVKTFFAVHETRYRPKAIEMKESTMLHAYKLQRSLVTFCEETKDDTEPVFEDEGSSSSDSEDLEEEGDWESKAAKSTEGSAAKPTRKYKKKRRGGWPSDKKKAKKRPREPEHSNTTAVEMLKEDTDHEDDTTATIAAVVVEDGPMDGTVTPSKGMAADDQPSVQISANGTARAVTLPATLASSDAHTPAGSLSTLAAPTPIPQNTTNLPITHESLLSFLALGALQLHSMYLCSLAWAHRYKRQRMHEALVVDVCPLSSPTQYDPNSQPNADSDNLGQPSQASLPNKITFEALVLMWIKETSMHHRAAGGAITKAPRLLLV